METELHKVIAYKIREIREDTVWINGSDIAMTFKPLKMGLRMAHLAEDNWSTFKEKYLRIVKSAEKLYRIELSSKDIELDLEKLRMLHEVINQKKLVTDTVHLLNQEIKAGKRFLAEDASSTNMDIDLGIYPYVDSFPTTSG